MVVNGTPMYFAYDAQGQLTDDGPNEHDYDLSGNRTDTGYVTDDPGDGNRLLSNPDWDFTYDLEGNLTEKVSTGTEGIWTLAYDNKNHLVLAEHKDDAQSNVDLRVEYKYDVFENRIAKIVDLDGDGANVAPTRWIRSSPRSLPIRTGP